MSRSKRYVALLRGINVGGNNIIPMAALRSAFERMGCRDVTTYIQSGNVVFTAEGLERELMQRIEPGLTKTFGFSAKVVVLSAKRYRGVVAGAPSGFGAAPERFRYDILFTRQPMTPTKALEDVSVKPGVDEVAAGKDALYFRRLIAKATQSQLPKLIQRPAYQHLTIRNWNTVNAIAALLES